jgi:putative transposase
VTFRLGDSIPQSVLREWAEERKQSLRKIGLRQDEIEGEGWKKVYMKLPKQVRRAFEQQFSKRFHESLDRGHGSCVLRNARCAEVVAAAALDHLHPIRAITGDFVVMPKHVHVLLRPSDGFELEEAEERRQDTVSTWMRHPAADFDRFARARTPNT